MLPSINILTEEITEIEYGNKTYKIEFTDNEFVTPETRTTTTVNSVLGSMIIGTAQLGVNEDVTPEYDPSHRINGYIDDIEAIIQTIYLILSTERYKYPIYSWDYGVELLDLIGKPIPYVMAELPRRIKDALTQDNRIDDVVDFEFERKGKKLHTTFTVVTNIGNISSELEVEV